VSGEYFQRIPAITVIGDGGGGQKEATSTVTMHNWVLLSSLATTQISCGSKKQILLYLYHCRECEQGSITAIGAHHLLQWSRIF
jgi:hypothetical protein